MTNQTKTRVAQLGLGLLAALCGYLLVGCDGGGGATGIAGFTDSPACAKADAIHVISTDQNFATAADESNYIVARAFQLCVGWSAGTRYPTQPDGTTCAQQLMLAGLLQSQATAECAHVMTEAECSDVQHDFVDSAGVKHTFLTVSRTTVTEFGLLLDPPRT